MTLPDYVFADVIGFLHLYELDAVLPTNARYSDLAQSAASRIRVFDFSNLEFEIAVLVETATMCVLNRTTLTSDSGAFAFIRHLTQLEFLDTVELFEFISTALRKCVLGSLDLRDDVALDAIKKVAHTIVIKDKLVLYADTFVDVPTMVEFVENFRVVEVRPLPLPICF